MGRPRGYSGFGVLNLGTISTAGWTGNWQEIPIVRQHVIEMTFAGSTAAITGTVALEGALSTGQSSPGIFTLLSYSSTVSAATVLKQSTLNAAVKYIRIKSTGLASTASTSTSVAISVVGQYAGVP